MGTGSRGGADAARPIQITDFSAGLNSMYGGLSLGLNEALADNTQNVIGIPGRAFYCGGFTSRCVLSSTAPDNAYQFSDASSVKHQMVWRDGNLYDAVSGTETLVETSAYTAGEDVGRVDRNGILYWCSASTAMRKWIGSGAPTAVSAGPKGTYLTSFAGSIIVANPTPDGSTYQPGAFLPSNVNSETFNTSNMVQVGTDFSGIISFVLPMGVSAYGIAPSQSILVGKTAGSLHLYTGALGNQAESLVNCPVGCMDPHSAAYIPSPTLFGEVMFLGTDAQLWLTNGVTAEPISEKNQSWVFSLFTTARSALSTQRFFATYNNRYQYYLIDLGNNQQLIYRWKTKSFFFINGWPSGCYIQGTDTNGFATNFVAATSAYTAGFYQVGMDATDFGGVAPTITYQTPYLHGGDPELEKEWLWVALATRNLGMTYEVTGSGMRRADGTAKTSRILTFADSAAAGDPSAGMWDVGQWDVMKWGSDSTVSNIPPQIKHGMIAMDVAASAWVPTGVTQPLRSGAISFSISWKDTGDAPQFDILGLFARYIPRGRRTVGGQKYSAQSGRSVTGADFYMGDQST